MRPPIINSSMLAFGCRRRFVLLLLLFDLMAFFDQLALALAALVTTEAPSFFDRHRSFFFFRWLVFFLRHGIPLRGQKTPHDGS